MRKRLSEQWFLAAMFLFVGIIICPQNYGGSYQTD